MRQGDDQWDDIVSWVVYALIEAEEKGITSQNVDEKAKSEDPDVKRMLGATPGMGKALGLDEKWAYNAVKAVGNYGEIFERNVGKDSPLKLDRGLNDLWTRRRADVRDADPLTRVRLDPVRCTHAGTSDAIARPKRPPPWHDPVVRGVVFQVLFVAAVVALGAFLVHNTLDNLSRQNIATGFGFLDREAGFGIGEHLIPYSPAEHLCPRVSGRADQHALCRGARHRAGDRISAR